MPNLLNSIDFKLNLSSLIIYNSKSYSVFRKILPGYWFIRPMTKFMLKNLKNENLIGAEIGVEYGINAKTMLRFLPIKKLYLIDPYQQKSGDICFNEAKRFLRKYKNKIEFIRMTSEEAISKIPNDLDFIYIDGNHEYDIVKKDILLYYNKVKQGGIIGGHDFWADHIGVCKAVIDFINENKIKLEGGLTDWWFIKK